jgi:hypothetical protein
VAAFLTDWPEVQAIGRRFADETDELGDQGACILSTH